MLRLMLSTSNPLAKRSEAMTEGLLTHDPTFLTQLPTLPNRVVILRATRLGDFICATPAFRGLRQALPDTEITLIAMPFVESLVQRFRSSSLDGRPYIDRFLPFPGFPGMAEQFFQARPCLQFLQQRQQEDYDLAIQLHGSGVYSNPFALMLGAKKTVGFVRPADQAGCLDLALPFPADLHAVDQTLALITALGVAPQGRSNGVSPGRCRPPGCKRAAF
jgi:ADP-heptose:LPS heptosyltransferase